jgi:hypothetical protein
MPGFNGTGPMGAGPMTGGGRGYCTGGGVGFQQGYGRQGFGRGRGRGYGRGFNQTGAYPMGNAPQYNAPDSLNSADELRMLRAQADQMRSALDNIQRRMDELTPTKET